MNIEESKSLLSWANINKLYIDTHNECDYHNIHTAIETLLTAYEKEKEQNSKLLEALDTVNHEKSVFIESYEKEKKKNKSLLQCLKDSQERCENEHLFLGNPDM